MAYSKLEHIFALYDLYKFKGDSMFKVTKYPQGAFSWADCSSTDVAKSKQFYIDVMGWSFEDIPIGEGQFYTMYKHDGETVAAMSGMQQAMKDQGVPSHWNNYVTVDDVDAMTKKAKDLGATIIAEPFDVFESGRMSVFQDPVGAVLSMWQPKNHIGGSLVNTPGAMTWNELMTRDTDKAKDFYTKLFGWTYETDERGYIMIANNGRPNGGILKMDDSFGDMPPTWGTYFSVANIEDTEKKVKSAGGKVNMGITDAGEAGRFIVASDPTGAVCTFMQLNQPQPWEE